MKLFKKRTIALALACAAALFASCRTEFEGEVEGEYADDGIKTEVGIDSSAAACSGWKKFYAYAFATGETEPLGAWPGTEMTALTGEYAGFYATNVTGIGSSEYSLIFHNGDGKQFDAGKFTKGGSWLWNADGDWSDNWRFETTVIADDPEPTDDEEDDGEVIDLTGLCIRGDMNSWGTSDTLTKNSDGTYSVTFKATAASMSFKISDASWTAEKTYGMGTIALGSEGELTLADGDNSNASFTGLTNGTTYKVTITPTSKKLKVVIEATENTENGNNSGSGDSNTSISLVEIETLYITGTLVGGWTEPGAEGSKAFTETNGVYSYDLALTEEATGSEFKIFTKSGWDNGYIASTTVTSGSTSKFESASDGNASATLAAGNYKLVVIPGVECLYLTVIPESN